MAKLKHILAVCIVTAAIPANAADLVTTSTTASEEFANCAFVTNDCEVCTVSEDGAPQCSSTGIACVPTAKTCLIPKTK